jgi:hypothetical protein
MPLDDIVQIPSKDGCIYIFEPTKKCWFKFCPVDSLPLDVRNVVKDLKDKADLLKDAI